MVWVLAVPLVDALSHVVAGDDAWDVVPVRQDNPAFKVVIALASPRIFVDGRAISNAVAYVAAVVAASAKQVALGGLWCPL